MSGSWLTRRTFVALCAGTAVFPWACRDSRRAEDRAELEALAKEFTEAGGIGKMYLEVTPEESSWEELIGALLDEIESLPVSAEGSVRLRLRAAARRDFSEGRIVNLDGWRLARTELRLYALAHLSS